MTALLDTHVLVWWLDDRHRLSDAQRGVVASACAESPLLVSDISLWEVAMLHDLAARGESPRCIRAAMHPA